MRISAFFFLPLLVLGAIHLAKAHHIDQLSEEVAFLYHKAALREKRQGANRVIRERHLEGDPAYLEHLQDLKLCQQEREALAELVEENPLLPNRELIGRLDFLSKKNRLQFSEEVANSDAGMQESQVTLLKEVEIDAEDLLQLLASLEQANDAPQIIIKNFHIKRKKVMGDNEVFSLKLKLIKREFS